MTYLNRILDYLNDPFYPKNDKLKPWVIFLALWSSLFNKHFYK